MAGQTKTRTGTKQPRLRHTRPARRRAALAQKLGAATTPHARLLAAFDYVRGANSRRHPDQDAADQLVDGLVQQLITAGDELLAMQAKEVRNP